MTRFLFVYVDTVHLLQLNSSYWRCFVPAAALRARGHSVDLLHINNMYGAALGAYDVVIYERQLWHVWAQRLREHQQAGARVYCTFDDCYHLFPDLEPYKSFYEGRKTMYHPLREFEQNLGWLNGYIVPAQALADYYSKFGQPVVIGNYFADEWLAHTPQTPDVDLIWSGNATHTEGLSNSGCSVLFRKYRSIINCTDTNLLDYIERLGVPFELVTWTKQDKYLDLAGRAQVGIAPLAGEYDRYRSTLKVLLYALAGLAWIASDHGVYDDCRGGILVKNKAAAWEVAAREVFENRQLYVTAGRAWALTQSIGQHVEAYEKL